MAAISPPYQFSAPPCSSSLPLASGFLRPHSLRTTLFIFARPRFRPLQPSRRLVVRAVFDGRSVVLAFAAAAANLALIRFLFFNHARMKDKSKSKSKELSGYSDLDVQNSRENVSHISYNVSHSLINSVSSSHFNAQAPINAQTIEKHEMVTSSDPKTLMENSCIDMMLEVDIANMEESERDNHECVLQQGLGTLVDTAAASKPVTEFTEYVLNIENINEGSARTADLNQTLIDHQLSVVDSQSYLQGKIVEEVPKVKPSGLIPPLAKRIARSEREKKSSFSSTSNKVGTLSRTKRSVKGSSFVKQKPVYRRIDDDSCPSPREAHIKRESRSPDYLKAYIHFLREGRLTNCLEVLENADNSGSLDMNKVYHVRFLNACKNQKAVNEAFRYVKLIKNPTLSTFNMLLSVCACSQDFEGAFQVLLLIKEADLKADCRLYTTLISTCAKSGKVDVMFEIFHEMVNADVVPNVHTYGALIDGCARVGQVAKAFGAYGIMRSKNVVPDRVIFNALITACGQSGAVDRAFDVLAEMGAEPTPIEPDHVTVGALMKTCAQSGKVDRAREVYKLMQQYNIKGTPEVYTIAVNSCSESGDLDFALMVYNDMKQNSVVPDEMFLSALIDAAGHAGKVHIAFEILQKARMQGVKLGIISYSSLMGACCNSNNWQKALELYEDMKTIKLLPTVSTANALITVLCEANQLKRSAEILAEVREAGVILNAITYSVLIVACERTDEVELGLKLFSEARLDGVTPNLIMCKCLTGLCLRRYEKAFSWGEPIFEFGSGRLQLDNRWYASYMESNY